MNEEIRAKPGVRSMYTARYSHHDSCWRHLPTLRANFNFKELCPFFEIGEEEELYFVSEEEALKKGRLRYILFLFISPQEKYLYWWPILKLLVCLQLQATKIYLSLLGGHILEPQGNFLSLLKCPINQHEMSRLKLKGIRHQLIENGTIYIFACFCLRFSRRTCSAKNVNKNTRFIFLLLEYWLLFYNHPHN